MMVVRMVCAFGIEPGPVAAGVALPESVGVLLVASTAAGRTPDRAGVVQVDEPVGPEEVAAAAGVTMCVGAGAGAPVTVAGEAGLDGTLPADWPSTGVKVSCTSGWYPAWCIGSTTARGCPCSRSSRRPSMSAQEARPRQMGRAE